MSRNPPALMSMLRLVALILAAMVVAMTASAQDLPQPVSDSVNDFAAVLSAQEIAALDQTLKAARQETGIQIVAVTLDGPVDDIADYARRMFDAWGVGDPGRNDGILIMIDRTGRRVRVALGAGYDPVWDGAAQRAIDTAMLPALRDGQFARGLQDGAQAVIERIARPFAAGRAANPPPAGRDRPALIPMILAGGFFAAVLAVILRGRLRRGDGKARSLPLRENARQDRGRNPDRDRDNDGKGGGGFGGGRSSGGGASGRF